MATRPHAVLLVEDEPRCGQVLTEVLRGEGYEPDVERDAAAAVDSFRRHEHPVVVLSLDVPGLDAPAAIRSMRQLVPDVVVVVTSGRPMAAAQLALGAGAYDFVRKPCDHVQFSMAIRRAAECWHLRARMQGSAGDAGEDEQPLVVASAPMQRVLALADRVARTNATVLIQGESGTGKELLARRIHRNSCRCAGPFVVHPCGAVPRDLLETELFGHVRGAFTGAIRDRRGRFEQAHGGTLFIDQVTEIPLDLQPRFLRVLQEKVVDVVGRDEPLAIDVRIIAATSQDLGERVRQGAFRDDLFFRLSVFVIAVPPLRERRADIAPLVHHFLHRHGWSPSRPVDPRLLRAFESQDWRGNVRELESACQRVALFDETASIEEAVRQTVGPAASAPSLARTRLSLPRQGIALRDIERAVIQKALEMNDYNQSRTARFLRIPRHILLYRAQKFGIPLRRPDGSASGAPSAEPGRPDAG
jgi:two-component system NtrC family response regulator